MKKKLYITRGIKIVCLLLLVAISATILQRYILCHYDGNRMRLDGYYLEDKDSLDVVFIGASDCYASFAPGLAYEKYGFTSYAYATASNTAGATKTMIKEVMRTQSPKVLLIEVNAFLYGFDNETKTSSVRNYIDNVPYNSNKIEYLSGGNIPATEDEIEYYVPLIKYHGTWNDYPEPSGKYVTQMFKQHMNGSTKLKGYRTRTAIYNPLTDYSPINYTLENNNKTLDLMPQYEAKLREVLEFCQEEHYDNVVFLRMPHIVDKSTYNRFKRGNRAGEIISEYGFDYINFERDPVTLAYSVKDYYNIDHLNIYGATKFTEYFGKILTEEYGVTASDLTESQKADWEEAVKYYHRLYDYCDNFINTETKVNGVEQTLEENLNVMKYIDDYAETGKMPKIEYTTSPEEEQ